jgi:hypothetical protein
MSMPFISVIRIFLLTQTESLDNGTVAVDVLTLEIVEETTTLTYELYE